MHELHAGMTGRQDALDQRDIHRLVFDVEQLAAQFNGRIGHAWV
jgi:hypothetical protein